MKGKQKVEERDAMKQKRRTRGISHAMFNDESVKSPGPCLYDNSGQVIITVISSGSKASLMQAEVAEWTSLCVLELVMRLFCLLESYCVWIPFFSFFFRVTPHLIVVAPHADVGFSLPIQE
jgi:hypothetical protein